MSPADLPASLGSWRLAEPLGLLALILVPLPWIAAGRRPRIAWPTLDGFRDARSIRAGWVGYVPGLLRSLAIACLAVALARPQAVGGRERIAARGVAIEAVLDRSSSMATADFPSARGPTTRLEAALATLAEFIAGRPDDLVGVVVFAGIADRLATPTLDHGFVLDAARAIRPARPGEAGTNLGHAIALGLGELKAVKTPKKVLILITDGRDEPPRNESSPPIEPEEAARLAPLLGVTLHTIAVGRGEATGAPGEPAADPGPDLERLERLARLGGGRPFAAADRDALAAVLAEIDRIEKSPLAGTIRTRYREGYPAWIVACLASLVLERFLTAGPLRRVP